MKSMLQMLKNYFWLVSCISVGLYSSAVADFILDKYSNFVAFFHVFIFIDFSHMEFANEHFVMDQLL
jgi:hypothetical protein